ncbi:unnamed protein product [Tilletia caries]|uniref:Telomere replication protein EST3 n=1 Tax=Tilletia controversa TaxID=13291 RepID=A0A8X7MT95_9BASI|nr:hypothetical protein CF336_g3569 [Tilletia laevis]KAE8198552.1 hypothetical protein CF328_g3519 [Tilletia controversa]CAD6888957.1 unnamed protein product [Tilletia caries]KAE8247724.1 hypothetical protein A4X06_0g4241 [Tilletia controversa]CAD6948021.1 unnamed protein product [Tilletia caries]
MSSSVHPWVRAFAFAYADCQQRADTLFRPGKKVQVVKFLTFRPVNDPFAPLDIWAQVSDPEHFVACRFLASSVTSFRRTVPPFADLTSLKGSILLIKAARATVWPDRVPAQVQNSPWAHIRPGTAPGGAVILEVMDWKLLGCTGEEPFWESAQEIASVDRRRLVKIQQPERSRANVDGGCDSDEDAATSAMRGQVLRQWIAEVVSNRMRTMKLEGNVS